MSERLSLHLRITGRVQGVGYRYWAEMEARRLSLSGWARNRSDGSVEILVVGAEESVKAFAASAWQGPPAAKVAHVAQAPSAEAATLASFTVLPTL